MLKKTLATYSLIAFTSSVASIASAETFLNTSYITTSYGHGFKQANRLNIAANNLRYNKHTQNQFNLGLGSTLSPNSRSDLILSHLNNGGTRLFADYPTSGTARISTKVKSTVAILSGYYDFISFYPSITPFIGAGFGLAHNKMENVKLAYLGSGTNSIVKGKSRYHFAYRTTAGVTLALSDNTQLDISYNYMNLGRTKTHANIRTKKVSSHQAMVGLRFAFN